MEEWHQAEFHARRARRFYESGQWDKALAELRLALAFDPNQSDWHLGMGLTLEALHRFDEAVHCFEQVIRLRGEDVDTMLHLAVDMIRSDQCGRAVQVLQRISEIDPACESAYCHRILAHSRLAEHEEAEEAFYLARQIVDECPVCFDHIAQSLEARGVIDRSAWCWQQALRLDTHYPGAHANLSRVYFRKGQLERAHHHGLMQLREDPGDTATLLRLGDILIAMDRRAEASEKFRRVLELEPASAAAHHALGDLALHGGHVEAAVAALEMAHRLDPERPCVRLSLARAAHKRSQRDAASSYLRAELDLGGHAPLQSLDIAELFIELDQPETAIAVIEPLLLEKQAGMTDEQVSRALLCRGVASLLLSRTPGSRRNPGTPENAASHRRANAPATPHAGGPNGGSPNGGPAASPSLSYADAGIRDLRRAAKLAPTDLLPLQNLALAYLRAGRLKRAMCCHRKAATLHPHATSLRHLARHLTLARAKAIARRVVRFGF